jgi:hypothetical protein
MNSLVMFFAKYQQKRAFLLVHLNSLSQEQQYQLANKRLQDTTILLQFCFIGDHDLVDWLLINDVNRFIDVCFILHQMFHNPSMTSMASYKQWCCSIILWFINVRFVFK